MSLSLGPRVLGMKNMSWCCWQPDRARVVWAAPPVAESAGVSSSLSDITCDTILFMFSEIKRSRLVPHSNLFLLPKSIVLQNQKKIFATLAKFWMDFPCLLNLCLRRK